MEKKKKDFSPLDFIEKLCIFVAKNEKQNKTKQRNWLVWFFITNSQSIYTKIEIVLQTVSVLLKASFWLHKPSVSSRP